MMIGKFTLNYKLVIIMAKTKKFRVLVKLDRDELPVFEMEGKDWTEVCDYVFGNIEVIEVDKNGKEVE